jgi:hypothetical protein
MKKLFIGLVAVLSLSAFAKEGGNGGGAFVCRDSKGIIISAELVDFVEGRAEYGLTIPKNEKAIEDQINRAINRMLIGAPRLAAELQTSVDEVKDIMNISFEVELENTNDFNLRIKPRDCTGGKFRFEQLANYTDDGRLVIDGTIYNKLPTTDKAALIVHEAAYLLARKWQDAISSREARRLTAHLFSSKDIKTISDKIFAMELVDPSSNKVWSCVSVFTTSNSKLSDGKWIQSSLSSKVVTTGGSTIEKALELMNTNYIEFQKMYAPRHNDERRQFRACAGDSVSDTNPTMTGTNYWHTWACPGRVFTPALDCKKN